MALKNTQYDEIMREYYRKQTEDRHEQEERIRRATEALPELAAIDHEIASLSISSARKALEGDETALSHLREDIKALSEKKTELLTSHGYPADYLEMHYHCPDCQDTGYIGQEKCHCFRQAVIDLLYTQSNIREILEEENFDHFSFRYYSDTAVSPTTGLSSLVTMKKLVAESMDFIRNFDTDFQNFFFYGDTGVGKTFLSHCIARELLKTAHSVIYFSAFELFDLLGRTTFQRGETEEEMKNMHAYIFDCDLLIIDDLGTELTNSFISTQLFLCINERLARRKSTIISTNLGLNVFRDTYSERVFSRITSRYKMRKFFGDDIRILKKLKNPGSLS